MAASKIPPSAAAAFIDPDRIDAILEPIIPDDEDRSFVLRCVLREGPVHHRGANYVLIVLLGQALEAAGAGAADVEAVRARGVAPVPMRVPPHLSRTGSVMTYPVGIPSGPLEHLAAAGTFAHSAMTECLADGPPQHALANAVMTWLVGALLERLEDGQTRKSARPSARSRTRK